MKKLIAILLMAVSMSGFAATNAQCTKANNNMMEFGLFYKSVLDNALGSREEKLTTTTVTFDEYKKWTENKFNHDIKELMITASKNNNFSYAETLSYSLLPRIVAAHSYVYNYLETKDVTNLNKLKELNEGVAKMYKVLQKECSTKSK